MNPRQNGSLSITDDNRHQYLETAIASVSEADHIICQAEARGRRRQQRESEIRQLLKQVSFGALAAVMLGALLALLLR